MMKNMIMFLGREEENCREGDTEVEKREGTNK